MPALPALLDDAALAQHVPVVAGAALGHVRQDLPAGHLPARRQFSHHGQTIANWTLSDADGSVITDGGSYARFGEDGKLTIIVGFF